MKTNCASGLHLHYIGSLPSSEAGLCFKSIQTLRGSLFGGEPASMNDAGYADSRLKRPNDKQLALTLHTSSEASALDAVFSARSLRTLDLSWESFVQTLNAETQPSKAATKMIDVSNGFAARCESTAPPRRMPSETNWAQPAVRALPPTVLRTAE